MFGCSFAYQYAENVNARFYTIHTCDVHLLVSSLNLMEFLCRVRKEGRRGGRTALYERTARSVRLSPAARSSATQDWTRATSGHPAAHPLTKTTRTS